MSVHADGSLYPCLIDYGATSQACGQVRRKCAGRVHRSFAYARHSGRVGAITVQPASAFCETIVAAWLHIAGKILADQMQPQCYRIADPINATSIGLALSSRIREARSEEKR